MRRIYFEPHKSVCGVPFGTPKKEAEGIFTESLGKPIKERVMDVEKDIVESTYPDDIKVYYKEGAFSYMRAVPDRNHVNIIIGSRNISPISESAIMKGIGMKQNPDPTKGVRVTGSGRKFNVDMFSENDIMSSIYVDDVKPIEEKTTSREPKKPEWMFTKQKETTFEEATTSLTQFYNDVKKNPETAGTMSTPFTPANPTPARERYMSAIHHFADGLKNDCAKHIILHVYCHMNPLDKDYIDANKPKMAGDVDNMLASKGMTSTAYLTSCGEKTKAPVLEFVNRSLDFIAQDYIERMVAQFNEADELGIQLPPPTEAPSTDDPAVKSQLGEITSDDQFDSALDKIRAQTRSQIVDNISKLIIDKKNEKEMTFSPEEDNTDAKAAAREALDKQSSQQAQQQPQQQQAQQAPQSESAMQVCMNFIAQHQIMENVHPDKKMQDYLMGMAIRECTLYEMDKVFAQVDRFNEAPFIEAVEKGNGVVVNEVSITESFNM